MSYRCGLWQVATGLFILSTFFTATPFPAFSEKVVVEATPTFVSAGPRKKPFNVTRHVIPLRQIMSGGVSRDQIPALFHPEFVSAAEGGARLSDSDRVLGVFIDGQAKAYPVRILNYHELVNDAVGGRPVLVSW